MTSAKPRHDYYQTDQVVHLSIYAKGLTRPEVSVKIESNALNVQIRPSDAQKDANQLVIDPLFAEVDGEKSTFDVKASKIEVHLVKKASGQWSALQGISTSSSSSPSQATVTAPHNFAPSSTSGIKARRSKWDSFTDDTDEPSQAQQGSTSDDKTSTKEGGQDGNIDAFFQKLYADADDDTRRAMQKSFVESGGTALSTNWKDVGTKKVNVVPPKGVEARKYEQ
ncbi:Suppressor of G2 allele of skp1 [Ceraceosorus bombacis]|uniref:Suppressor of G2 allele of skp1 n=1 Tax=Ceraceosorus bombacis TaxID=401625 RepID=A0A0P1BNH8_9BASI|nr:Suppressor of G2 allele of skp1 [Ceraceosorus bombacis]